MNIMTHFRIKEGNMLRKCIIQCVIINYGLFHNKSVNLHWTMEKLYNDPRYKTGKIKN